jgi:hypothetical protein
MGFVRVLHAVGQLTRLSQDTGQLACRCEHLDGVHTLVAYVRPAAQMAAGLLHSYEGMLLLYSQQFARFCCV